MFLFFASHSEISSVLQDFQKLPLQGKRQFRYFIKEQCTTFRNFKIACLTAFSRPCECPIFIAEQFTFDQLIRNCRAINMNKGCILPSASFMDFLCQEIFREFNTIGSKANDSTLAHLVVAAKTELEKIREQVQNIE